jgi:streptomycin 6-kinase
MPQYKPQARTAAARLERQAEVFAGKVRQDIQRASNYVLGVVLFASALFFAGMSTKLTAPRLRVAMLALGCTVFLLTAVWIATSPVSVSV